MSTVGAGHLSRRSRTSRQHVSAPPVESSLAVWLTQATDLLLVITLVAVPACFAGRTPLGQLLFVTLSVVLALVWSLRQLAARTPAWRSTATVWLWGAGAALAGLQLLPLSNTWLDRLSPEISRLLVLWNSESSRLFPSGWRTLSLNPAETSSGLATFLSYALLFLVVVQRLRHRDDIARLLKAIVVVAIGMAVFGLLQYLFSNGKFFWVYAHPSVSTTETILGTFTNRNHLAQFLALAIGPSLWWLSQAAKPSSPRSAPGFSGPGDSGNILMIGCLACGLGAIWLAGLMTLSRAGTLAMAVAGLVSLALLSRRGHLPGRAIPTVMLIGVAVGCGALATNYQLLADRFDHLIAGDRSVIWGANLRLVYRFPWFGTGVGTHLQTHQLETDRIDDRQEFTHAESGYLQVASECGLIGLALAAGMIAACLRWCRAAYRLDAGPESTAQSAAISASFAANLMHAGVDFFWYAPGCMVVVTVMAACACRLCQLAIAARGVPEPVRHPPRWLFASSLVGLTALAVWMISIKLPGAAAEPHIVEYITLQKHGEDLVDSPDELERLMMTEIVAAARANPQDCRAQLRAAEGYLRVFRLRQEAGENPMSLDQLRDAAIGSEFDSAEDLNEWMDAVVGSNRKYLRAARHYARRALSICPLEGMGYIFLAKLEFLRDPQGRWEDPLRQQALAVRPYDATIDFEVGHAASWNNDPDQALAYWRRAFRRSPVYREEIAAALAGNYPANDLIEQLRPDREGLYALVEAYAATDRDDDLAVARQNYARACRKDAPHLLGPAAEHVWKEAVRMSIEAGDPVAAIRAAKDGLKHMSQSLALHKTLGELLMEQQDYSGAAEHLQWAALRDPNDKPLERLAAAAVKEKLRRQDTRNSIIPAGHQSLR